MDIENEPKKRIKVDAPKAKSILKITGLAPQKASKRGRKPKASKPILDQILPPELPIEPKVMPDVKYHAPRSMKKFEKKSSSKAPEDVEVLEPPKSLKTLGRTPDVEATGGVRGDASYVFDQPQPRTDELLRRLDLLEARLEPKSGLYF